MFSGCALFSHLVINTELDVDAAKWQLKTWCAAGFRKQERLWADSQSSQIAVSFQESSPKLAPQPLWVWRGDGVQLWIAVMDTARDEMYFLYEDNFLINANDLESLRKIVVKMASIMSWGHDHYTPWFRQLIRRDDLTS